MPADKLGFGIIDTGTKGVRDVVFEAANDTEAAKGVMHALGIDSAVISKYGKYMEQSGNSLGFSDILGMRASFMPLQGSSIERVMKVHRDVDRGPTCSTEGFLVFHLRLEKYEKEGACSEQMLYLPSKYRWLKGKWEEHWERPMHANQGFALPTEFSRDIRELWSEVMHRLEYNGQGYVNEHSISHLVASHITHAVEYPELAKAALNDIVQRQKIAEGFGRHVDLEVAAGMHLYIDRIPLVVSSMKYRGYGDERKVIDTWWTLIFRAMLWHRGHSILKGKTRGYGGIPVSPSFWGSKLPVYIA